MCTWRSINARSAGAWSRVTITGAATPTVEPGAGEMPVVTSPAGVTVVYVPVIGTGSPSAPVAVPDTV